YKEERAAAMAVKRKRESGWFGLKKLTSVKFRVPGVAVSGPAIPIRGINGDLPVSFAPDGGAVPGDRIVGILTPGEGITIYPIQSAALGEFEDKPDRWLDVRWDEEESTPQRFPARIAVQSVNEPGSLAQITQVIAENDGNIDNIRMTRRAPDFTDVLIDLDATIRNARGGRHPDPVRAAKLAIAAGCDGITAHLREDRRHIRDDDIARLKAEIDRPLNFEMAATEEMISIALKTKPHAACLVPEKRTERTTEGGLDAVGQRSQLAPAIGALKAAGIRVSLFIGAAPEQIEMAAELGAPAIEIHTGSWCDALAERRVQEAETEWQIIRAGAARASGLGLEVHAGHGLDYGTAEIIAALPQVVELNIGHFIIG